MPQAQSQDSRSAGSLAPRVVALVLLLIYGAFLAASFVLQGGWLATLLRDHYVFFVGLPFAALIAYVLVSLLENTRGKIELEALGVKFRGASGPLVMWVLVFLSLIVGIRLTWGLQ